MNKLVIFDLDGVLFESRDMHFETLNRALMKEGLAPISRVAHEVKFNGLPTRVKLEMLHVTDEQEVRIRHEKQMLTMGWLRENVRINKKLISLLQWLRARGYKIAVCTNAVSATLREALDRLWLRNLVDWSVSGDSQFPPKPAPDMYFRCMGVLNSDPANTIIVEDSEVGVEGAKKTGAEVIIVGGPADVPSAVMQAIGVEP